MKRSLGITLALGLALIAMAFGVPLWGQGDGPPPLRRSARANPQAIAAGNPVDNPRLPGQQAGGSAAVMQTGASQPMPDLITPRGQQPVENIPAPALHQRVLAPFPIQSQTFTLADLEQIARQRHPALTQATARVQAAQGRWLQAGLKPNPRVGYSGQEIGNDGTVGIHGAFVSQQFITGGKLGLSQAVNAQQIRAAQESWRVAEFRVMADLRLAFINALVAQERLRLQQEILRISDDGVNVARAMVDAEENAPVDRIQAQIESHMASTRVEVAKAQLDGAWRNLSVAVGGQLLERGPLDGTLESNIPQFAWQESWNRLVAENPLLAAADARIAAARWNIQRQCAEPIPNVTVQAGVAHSTLSDHVIANLQFSLPIPVNDANQGAVAAARAEFTAAQRDLERILLFLERRLADVFATYDGARRQSEVYQQYILRDAQNALDLITVAYQQGERDYNAVLTAQRTLFNAKLQYLDSLQAAHLAAARLEFLLLDDALQ